MPRSYLSLSDYLATVNAVGEPLVVVEEGRPGVALIRFNCPERSNSWDEALELQFYRAIDACAEDEAVRAVVITGTGRHFSPGMDRARLLDVVDNGREYEVANRRPTILRDLPKPAIVAVNGACAGVAMVHAAMADVRFTSPQATWSTAFTRIGLIAEDGLAARIQALTGTSVATDLLLSARAVSGTEAVSIGLATKLAEPSALLDAALEYGQQLTVLSPAAMALTKLQLDAAATGDLGDAVVLAAECLKLAKGRPDYREGVHALVERRQPNFEGMSLEIWRSLVEAVDSVR